METENFAEEIASLGITISHKVITKEQSQ